MRGTAPAGAFRSATAEGGSWRVDNPRRDTPSARTKQRILRIRCLGALLETGLLDPPPAALRLFPCAIEIISFQNFYKVLKICSAGRKDFFDTLSGGPCGPPPFDSVFFRVHPVHLPQQLLRGYAEQLRQRQQIGGAGVRRSGIT